MDRGRLVLGGFSKSGSLARGVFRVEAPLKSCPVEKPLQLFISIQAAGEWIYRVCCRNAKQERDAGLPSTSASKSQVSPNKWNLIHEEDLAARESEQCRGFICFPTSLIRVKF